MNTERLKEWITSLDGFPKFDTAYLNKTSSGGLTTIVTYILMAVLMFSELYRYAIPQEQQRYAVDPTIGSKIKVSLDISVASECGKLVILQVEQTGETQVVSNDLNMEDMFVDEEILPEDFVHHVKTARVGEHYTYASVTGCRIRGTLTVNKGQGRLMVMPLMSALGPLGQVLGRLDDEINFSHYIHHLSFGVDSAYPGMVNPLDNSNQLAMAPREHFTYFLSIIPTVVNTWGRRTYTNQYVVNGFKGKKSLQDSDNPGLFFRYDHEPLAVFISKSRINFRSFLVHLVGILGGVYTCSGILHRLMQWAFQSVKWVFGRDGARKRAARLMPVGLQ